MVFMSVHIYVKIYKEGIIANAGMDIIWRLMGDNAKVHRSNVFLNQAHQPKGGA